MAKKKDEPEITPEEQNEKLREETGVDNPKIVDETQNTSRIADLEAEVENLKKQLEDQEQRLGETVSVDKYNEAVEEANATISEKEAKITELETRVNTLNSDLNSENVDAENQLAEKQRELDDMTERFQNLNIDLAAKDEHLTKIAAENIDLRMQVDTAEQAVSELRKSITEERERRGTPALHGTVSSIKAPY